MKNKDHSVNDNQKETKVDPKLDKLEEFFPEDKLERARARLPKIKEFIAGLNQEQQPSPQHA